MISCMDSTMFQDKRSEQIHLHFRTSFDLLQRYLLLDTKENKFR